MSDHIEWADATATSITAVAPGEIEGSDRPNIFAGLYFSGGGGGALLIEGKRADMVDLMEEALELAKQLPETAYVATVNTPGYLPESEDFAVFATEREAWEYLADELRRVEDDYFTGDGDEGYSATLNTLECLSRGEWEQQFGWTDGVGTVHGPTPGYEGDHDLGKAYSVTEAE